MLTYLMRLAYHITTPSQANAILLGAYCCLLLLFAGGKDDQIGLELEAHYLPCFPPSLNLKVRTSATRHNLLAHRSPA